LKNFLQISLFIEIVMSKNANIPAQALKRIRNDLFRLYAEIKNQNLPRIQISRINRYFFIKIVLNRLNLLLTLNY